MIFIKAVLCVPSSVQEFFLCVGERIRVIVGQNTHALERRSSDPGSFSVINSPFEDERGILAIQSSVLSSHSGVKKKSFSAGKERKDRGSSSSTAKGKDSLKNIEKRKKNKTGKHLSLRFNFRVSSCLPPPHNFTLL